jgi:hypothetical protein
METVTITKKEYSDLLKSQKKLEALESGGVDNWEWYDQSLQDAGFYDEDEPCS